MAVAVRNRNLAIPIMDDEFRSLVLADTPPAADRLLFGVGVE